MNIVFVRHTRVNVPPGTCYGFTDVPLADTFEAEAAVTKARLDILGPCDAAFTSPLTRARRLADFCGYPDATLDDRLKELNMGRWEMQRYEDIHDGHIEEWYRDYLHVSTPGGESFMQQCERVASFLDELRTGDYRQVVVFAHAGILVAASIYAGLYPLEEAWHHISEYGGLLSLQLTSHHT